MAGNVMAMLMGGIFFVLGVILTYKFWEDFTTVFRGCIGMTLGFVGLLAVVIGFSEYKATREFQAATSGGSTEPTPSPTPTEEPAAPAEEKA